MICHFGRDKRNESKRAEGIGIILNGIAPISHLEIRMLG